MCVWEEKGGREGGREGGRREEEREGRYRKEVGEWGSEGVKE